MQSRILSWPRSPGLPTLLAAVLTIFLVLYGSEAKSSGQENPFGKPGFGFGDTDKKVFVSAYFKTNPDGVTGQLSVRATIQDHWHIYSITQPDGGPQPTDIKVTPTEGFVLTGEFKPNSDPIIKNSGTFPVPEEEHKFGVVWTAPIGITPGTNLQELKIEIKVNGQCCESLPDGTTGTCVQFKESPIAAWEGVIEVAAADAKFKPNTGHVLWSGKATPGTVRPGENVVVELTAQPTDGFHIYVLESGGEAESDSPTRIVFSKSNGWEIAKSESHGSMLTPPQAKGGLPYFAEPVTWRFEMVVPADQSPGDMQIGGSIAFQTCDQLGCDPRAAISFSLPVVVSADSEAASKPTYALFSNSEIGYAGVAELAKKYALSGKANAGQWSSYSLPLVFSLAFLAGFILNFMPCVLPVIGLKIMSFVQQAGESPGRVIWLNTVFSFGIISIFLLLATLAVFFGLGWGELYKNTTFTVIMLSVVFVFGLSFFGIWEIPLPGFVGTAGSGAASKEGFTGTFLKGVLTTLLATPCSGPLIIPAVVWAIAQPWWLTYMAFLAMGLGMAAPYMLIGFFPALVKMLPRPGMWMETFKTIMGFVLMGTVVFFLSGVNRKYQVSTLSLLVFLGMACWWIGKTSIAAELGEKLKAWGYGTVITGLGIAFSFFVLLPQHELDWQPYSKFQFDKLLAEGNTVFVDFTADW